VLFPQDFKASRSLMKTIRNSGFETRLDTAFETVNVVGARWIHAADSAQISLPDALWTRRTAGKPFRNAIPGGARLVEGVLLRAYCVRLRAVAGT